MYLWLQNTGSWLQRNEHLSTVMDERAELAIFVEYCVALVSSNCREL